MRRMICCAALSAAVILGSGCYVWVDREPAGLERSRRRAQARVEKIESRPEEKRGDPHSLKIWVYDRSDDQLVKASIPLWIVKKILAHAEADESEDDGDLGRYGITLEKVVSRPPGLLVKIESDEEEVLAWLD